MSTATEQRHSSLSQEEDDEKFFTESTELARSFTELFIKEAQSISGDRNKSPLVVHENKHAPTAPTEEQLQLPEGTVVLTAGTTASGAVAQSLIKVSGKVDSHAVAKSLAKLSGKVDDQLDAKFSHSQAQVINRGHTIWDIGYDDFRTIMNGVFTSLDESLLERSSGWEMAALVYRGVAGLVRDMRQQSNDGSRAREGTVQSYVGNFLEEIGLMTWITGQGGLDHWGSEDVEQYRVPPINLAGTSV